MSVCSCYSSVVVDMCCFASFVVVVVVGVVCVVCSCRVVAGISGSSVLVVVGCVASEARVRSVLQRAPFDDATNKPTDTDMLLLLCASLL